MRSGFHRRFVKADMVRVKKEVAILQLTKEARKKKRKREDEEKEDLFYGPGDFLKVFKPLIICLFAFFKSCVFLLREHISQKLLKMEHCSCLWFFMKDIPV